MVIDVTIVSDMYDDINAPHWKKVEYYSQHEEIIRGAEAISETPTTFSSITISWRGIFAPQSASDLRGLGFSKSDLELLSAITVEQGAVVHRLFHRSAYTCRDFHP